MEKVFNKTISSPKIHEAVLYIENSLGDFSENYGYGGRDINSPMIAASITKMFTTACILKLYELGKLSLSDKISNYFDKEILNKLHIFKGRDYSSDLTISNLLFQTSGLPDEFESSNNSKTLKTFLEKDIELTFDEIVTNTKKLKPHFAPNGRKAYYSNINFDLLGKIIEKVTELPLAEVYKQFVFGQLKMNNTYLPTNENDFVPHIYYKNQKIERPKLISSCGASGGCITTPKDLMIFSKSFWSGKLFDKKLFNELSIYHKLQFSKGPISYGGGYMKFNVGGLMTMFIGKGELLGHSGSTGSFAFFYPHKDLHFVGDLNQMANPAMPIRFLLKLVMETKKYK
ncbi:beta-lactamase [Sporocytophaga myxococcoides]|uniref:Beta-lactamase n=1 Tax=Sporocytophaga myxococcoides TaxID=153721 RepID=A0A098LIR9_9BACT|nr:serine hydrolase domain-containing protein [Sporocytophaga myxococcoides]GAL86349.1 beta-lactamase [Sporocytophaga myxococcoides]